MMFTDEQKKALSAPLDPKHIVKPTGRFGAKGDYIEGWHAIAEANRIFGHDGWSHTIELIKDALELGKDRDGNDQWQAAYTCICTVKAGGVERQDVGFGSGFAKQVGDAIEGATKEAATDALKRALRTFGHPFGLALYDKKRTHVGVSEPEPVEAISDTQRDYIVTLSQAARVSLQKICQTYNIDDLRQLPADAFDGLVASLNATIEKNKQKEPA